MYLLNDIQLQGLATHYVGNTAAGDQLTLSKSLVALDSEELKQALLHFFLQPFKDLASYKLWHPTDNALNEVYHFVSAIFEQPETLLRESANLARHLSDITTLPQIKSGELHVAYFSGIPYQGKMTEAIGICKTESRSNYLRLDALKNGYQFSPEEGINPEKMDKGCLILNVEKEDGYVLHVVDRTAKGGEAQFWKDTFLKVWALNDDYHATENYLRMSKEFIVAQVPEEYEVERVQQIEMLNKSAEYFKKNEQFEKAKFEEEVFTDPELIQSFRNFEQQYAQERDLVLDDEFEISGAAVKKNARMLKSVLKLDKNFHVYVHGNRELIERGFDPKTGLHFYKIYFEEEN
ncbi:MAG: nucleoid-associated protein [Bacteroidetes bacterium]|nr:nucleoid-associated protein [Bacteroidota bacterium]